MKPAVFLDRDGTLIREVEYLSRLDQLEVLPGVGEALRKLGQAGFLRILVSNQSGVARGYFDQEFVRRTHDVLREQIRQGGGDLEGVYFCPHLPQKTGPCDCRKPGPGMIEQACRDFPIDRAASWVVGDKPADLDLARNAGCHAALVRSGYGRTTETELTAAGGHPEVIADTLLEVVEEILKP